MKPLKCLALVIGNNSYKTGRWKPLAYAINDAKAVADKLQKLRFDVHLFTDVTSKDIVGIKDDILERLSNKYDAFVFYFAGHGTIANASDCLLLSDVDDKAEDPRIRLHSIVIDDFLNDVRASGDQMNIFIIDACRSAYEQNSRGGYITADFGINTKLPYQSFIAFGSSPGQGTKESSAEEHGLFTTSLLSHIDELNIKIEDLFKEIRHDVYKGRGSQLPWDYSCLVNDFCFNYGQTDPYFNLPYSQDAYEDHKYISENVFANEAITEFKSLDYNRQEQALVVVHKHFKEFSKDDLFVIGRNILQSAGACFYCQREISVQGLVKYNTANGDNDVLNGILYEIYFDSGNNIRSQLKYTEGLIDIERIAASKRFKKSFAFLKHSLQGYDVTYIPGETSKQVVNLTSEESDEDGLVVIKEIKYRGKDIINKLFNYSEDITLQQLENRLIGYIGIPENLLQINFSRPEHKNAETLHIEIAPMDFDIFDTL